MNKIQSLADLAKVRAAKIQNADAKPLPQTYPMNELVKALHPATQYLKITEIIEHSSDCLLYTSPSPRDISGSRMPSCA